MPDPGGVYAKVKSVFDRYGVPEFVWYPIALAESGMNPNASGDNGASIGLFQINRVAGQGIGYTVDQLRDPVTNAEIAAKAIVPAYNSIKNQVSVSQQAAETAVRSGHPGGSITQPFSTTDPRVQRIQANTQQFIAGVQAALPSFTDIITGAPSRNLISQAVPDVTSEIQTAIGSAVAPLQPIGDAVKKLSDRFNQIGAAGVLFGVVGLVLVVISLAAMFAESDAGKASGKAAVGAAKMAVLA